MCSVTVMVAEFISEVVYWHRFNVFDKDMTKSLGFMGVLDCLNPEAYSEHCQTSKTERFEKIVNDFQPLTIFVEHFIFCCLTGF